MTNIKFQVKKTVIFSLSILILVLLGTGELQSSPLDQEEKPQHKIEKPKIYREDYPIISDSDLYCSFFILGEESLEAKIVSAEKKGEMKLLTDSDVFYIDRGRDGGFEVDQVFLILEVGPGVQNPITKKKLGILGFKRGRARILDVGDTWGKAQVEKSCGQIMVGSFLIPFEEKEVLLESAPKEDVSQEGRSLWGNIVYLQGSYQMISRDHWALIDLGREDGLRVGDRMIISRTLSETLPPKLIGDLVIINTQSRTSTVKILSTKGTVQIGDQVQVKPKEESK